MWGRKIPEVGRKYEFLRDDEGRVDRSARVIRKALKGAAYEMVKEFPYVAGYALFGSRTKGRETRKSDLDVVVFINGDMSLPKKAEKMAKDSFRVKFNIRLLNDAHLPVKEAANITQKTDVEEIVLSFPLIKKAIQEGLTYQEGKFKDREEKDKLEESFRNNFLGPHSTVLGLFYLDIGGSLQPWRAVAIEELERAGLRGEKFWEVMMSSLKWSHEDHRTFFDRYGDRPSSKAKRPIADGVYPMTLERARKVYCSRQSIAEEQKQAA
jgi:predicted nucleotidyltransferase